MNKHRAFGIAKSLLAWLGVFYILGEIFRWLQ